MTVKEEKLPNNREAAAQLLASGTLEKQEIADKIGVSRTTLWNWEKNDKRLAARVEELKRDFENFGVGLIHSKLVEAVNGYWDLIQTSDNDMVRSKGYEYFLNRKLGTPKSNHDLTVNQSLENNNTYTNDDIKQVFDAIEEPIAEDKN